MRSPLRTNLRVPLRGVASPTPTPTPSAWTPANHTASTRQWRFRAGNASSLTLSGSDVTAFTDEWASIALSNTDTASPTLDTSIVAINNQDAIALNGSTQSMTATSVTSNIFDTSAPFPSIVLAVVNLSGGSGIRVVYALENGTSSRDGINIDASGSWTYSTSGFGSRIAGATASTGWAIVVGYHTGSTIGIKVNGGTATTAAQTTTATEPNTLRFGGDNGPSLRWPGHIAELTKFVGTGAYSADVVERLEGYAAHQYGLTALLPSGHPYKTTAPTV